MLPCFRTCGCPYNLCFYPSLFLLQFFGLLAELLVSFAGGSRCLFFASLPFLALRPLSCTYLLSAGLGALFLCLVDFEILIFLFLSLLAKLKQGSGLQPLALSFFAACASAPDASLYLRCKRKLTSR